MHEGTRFALSDYNLNGATLEILSAYSAAEGRTLMRHLRGRLSGTCLPTYVLDIPGGHGKVPITADYFRAVGPGLWQVEDWQGRTHLYHDPAD